MANYVKPLKINDDDNVYTPREDSYFLKNNLMGLLKEEAIEIGCGSGFVILTIDQNNPKNNFIAIDLNFNAAQLTRINSQQNGIENVQILTGDLMTCFRKKSLPKQIIFNPPYLPRDSSLDDMLPFNDQIQFVGGEKGFELSSRIVQEIANDSILHIIISSASIKIEDFISLHTDKYITLTNSMRLEDGEELYLLRVRNQNG